MTTLTSIATFFKKSAPSLLFALLITFTIFLIVLRLAPKKSTQELASLNPPVFEVISGNTSTFNTQRLDSPKEAPNQLSAYSLNSPKNFLDESQNLATKIGFTNQPQPLRDISHGEGLLYSNERGSLIVYKEIIIFQQSLGKPLPNRLSVEELKTKAASFLSNLGQSVDPTRLKITYSKISGEDLVETPDLTQAVLVNFTFNYRVDGLPVIGPFATTSINLDFGGNITAFNIRRFAIGTKVAQYPILNFNSALTALRAGNGKLILAAGNIRDDTALQQISAVSLKTAYLGYYLPGKIPETIQPVWIFEGQGEQDDEPLIELTFAVPAIEEKYLKISQP